MPAKQKEKLECFHCGDICPDDSVTKDGHYFCCTGCLFVYELLKGKDLDNYYELIKNKGLTPKKFDKDEFSFLDDPKVNESLRNFSIENTSGVTFYIPEIYCSACIYLLENLYQLDSGIKNTKVDFLRKKLTVTYHEKETSLRKIVELLTSIGYSPKLNLSDIDDKKKIITNKPLYIKLGIAGFCFGNIMLMSFPEYLSGGFYEPELKAFFTKLNILLMLPVLYSASIYFKSALNSLKVKYINIDVPVSIGIFVLFVRTVFEIVSGTGAGYADSMSGLVFFLLIGKVFQQKTYHSLSFDRDYKSYFPLSVIKILEGTREFISLKEIKKGDRLLIRNNEIVPTDSFLRSNTSYLDYSFVTGESKPVKIENGDKIFAGGRLKGSLIEVEALKKFNQSYLTQLWNSDNFKKEDSTTISNLSNKAAKYFTLVVLFISVITFLIWAPSDMERAINAVTSVLIVACPCAIALTIPFTFGTARRLLGKSDFYLKDDNIIEKISQTETIVFDKTGTLTKTDTGSIEFNGTELSTEEKRLIRSSVRHSTHPLSRLIDNHLSEYEYIDTDEFEEIPGEGLKASINSNSVLIGNQNFAGDRIYEKKEINTFLIKNPETSVFIRINDDYKGVFTIKPAYREKISEMMYKLEKAYKLQIITGDNESEKEILENIVPPETVLMFRQLPSDKLELIRREHSSKVMMVGDGLNDAGALNEANVGIAVTENSSNFTPGSDGILLADKITNLPKFLKFSRTCIRTVYLSYFISVVYHIIGFTFAVQGLLTPLVAAILMPISSISVVAFTVGKTKFDAKRLNV